MSSSDLNNVQVHDCKFEVHISEAVLNIRFPCRIFIVWKSASNKVLTKTINDNIIIQNNIASIQQTISAQVHLLYDKNAQAYSKKQTNLSVFLISKRKPDEQKLVGRITIDLAEVINNGLYSEKQNHVLNFCSVKDGSLTFNVSLESKQISNLKHADIESDSISVVSIPSKAANLSMCSGTGNDDGFQFKKQEKQNIANGSSRQIHFTSQKGEATLLKQIQQEKNKLLEENEQLKKIIMKNNEDLENIRGELSKAEQKIKFAQSGVERLQSEKETITDELLKQIKEETQAKFNLKESMKILENRLIETHKNYEESEQMRLQFESEMLEIKFELSQLKTERQIIQKYLTQKDEDLSKALSEIEELRKNQSFSPQASDLISDRQRQNYQEQIEKLGKKVQKLQEQIKFNEQTKQKMNEFNNAYNLLYNEKAKLEEHLRAIEKDRDRFQEAKKELQEKLLKPGESQITEEFETKLLIVQQETNRLRQEITNNQNEKHYLQSKIKDLQLQNSNTKEQVNQLNEILKDKDNLINSTSNALSQKETEFKTMEKYLHNKTQNQQSFQQQLQSLKNDKKKLQQVIAQSESKNKKLQSTAKMHQKQKQQIEGLSQKLNEQLIEMNKVRSELVNKNLQLESDLVSMEKKLSKVKNQMKTKEQILNEKRNTTAHLSNQMEEEIKKAQEYEERMMRLAEKEKKMRQNILVLEQQSKKIYDTIVMKEQNEEIQSVLVEELKIQNKKLQEENINFKNEIESLSTENNEIKRQLFQAKKGIIEKMPNVSEEQTKYEQMANLTNQRISELEQNLKNKENHYKNQMKEISDQLSKSKEKETLQNKKLTETEKQKNEFKAFKEEAQQRNKLLELNIIEIEEKISIISKNHQTQVEGLEMKLQAEKRQMDLLKKDQYRLKDDVDDYENRLTDQKNIINSYLQKIQDLQMSRYEASSISGKSFEPMNIDLTKKQTSQLDILKINLNTAENINKRLKDELQKTQKQLKQAKNESEQSMKEINHQLQKHFDKPKQKTAIQYEEKSIPKEHLVSICRELKKVLQQRSQKEKSQSVIEFLISKNSLLEDNMAKVTEERGSIQETARKLSMEFQKIKSKIFKGKADITQKKQYLDSLKPCEGIVKDLIGLAQSLSQVHFELEGYE